MIIDPITSIPASNATDIKEKKRVDTENLKPIEESGDSNGLELDFNKEDVATRRASKDIEGAGSKGIDLYSAKGELIRDINQDYENRDENGAIDLIA